MLGLIDTFARRLLRRGLQRGLRGGDGRYLAVGAFGLLLHLLTKAEEPKVAREELRLGEILVVTHLPPPPTRRQRRKARRAASGAEGA